MENINIIYGLRDPRNDVYYYIGKSTVGISRPLSHLTNSHSKKVNDWVSELKELGYFPIVDVIEEVSDINNLIDREKYWISYYYDINKDLLNTQSLKGKLKTPSEIAGNVDIDVLKESLLDYGELVSSARKLRGMSQSELSELTGYSRGTISLIESNGNVGIKVVKDVVDYLTSIDPITNVSTERVRRKN